MLSWTCRRFRARFTPGSAHPHRRACSECESFAVAVERAAGARLPLPAGLQRGLAEIARPATGAVLPFPVPRLPLPDALAVRLRSLPAGRPVPPDWVRRPFYAVAASTILALLLGPMFAGAASQGLQAVTTIRNEVSPLVQRTGESGKAEIGRLRTGAAAACGEARRSAEESLSRLDARVAGLSAWLSAVANEESTNRDPRGDAAGSTRRP